MKRTIFLKTMALSLCLFLILGIFCAASGAEGRAASNRYNIVLVVDSSGSMARTDGQGLRFSAIGKFVALLAEKGNRVGAVVFNEGIAMQLNMAYADGIWAKQNIVEQVRSIAPGGDTNIGKGLQTAVNMLNADGNPNLPSLILLLSDGNTDLPTEEEVAQSQKDKADAIQRAMELGYKIHAISLNADGSANSAELMQIANAVGGQFREVKKAADLDDVFKLYYALIYNAVMFDDASEAFPGSGEITGSFEVPAVGVEEVNIVLSGGAEDYSLESPHGRVYEKADIASFAYTAETYTIIKVTSPDPGLWKYRVKGAPGSRIQINIVYNTNLTAEISASPAGGAHLAGDSVLISVALEESGAAIAADKYSGFKAVLTVTGGKGGAQSFDMSASGPAFEYRLILEKSGFYTVKAEVAGEGYLLQTEEIALGVDNNPPVFEKNIEHTVLLWPFKGNEAEIDLSPGVSSPSGSALTYEALSSAFNSDEYRISGSTLHMSSYSLGKGMFKMRAYDQEGAYCDFDVFVRTVSITLLGALLLLAGLLIALAAIGVVTWMLLQKRFYGTCVVQQFDSDGNYYEESCRTKGRGRIRLSEFNLGNAGFDASKCYFQATGKRHVFLCMNESVYGDGMKGKKFLVNGSGFEVTVSKDEFSTKGVRARFISKLPGGIGSGW
ncbi:MAG: VWA domain-containing protein [Clostridiales bacterium]|nr:VWA domain-containing protein [Clostridiales bacterium]